MCLVKGHLFYLSLIEAESTLISFSVNAYAIHLIKETKDLFLIKPAAGIKIFLTFTKAVATT